MHDQTAQITWKDGVPIATAFDDPYYSLDNGLDETRHVFLGGNDLPTRFREGFEIAELGFGTGLNFLVTWAAWDAAGRPGSLRFTSFEAFPLALADMAQALERFPDIADRATRLTTAWHPGAGATEITPGLTLHVILGDARETLPLWERQADAWFLDGFSPARNPALWEPTLLNAVASHTRPGGTAATYSAAGHVRQNLAAAGFDVARVTGFGRKRHMTRALKPHAE